MTILITVLAIFVLIVSVYNLFKTYELLKRKRRNTLVVLSRQVKPIEFINHEVISYQINTA